MVQDVSSHCTKGEDLIVGLTKYYDRMSPVLISVLLYTPTEDVSGQVSIVSDCSDGLSSMSPRSRYFVFVVTECTFSTPLSHSNDTPS